MKDYREIDYHKSEINKIHIFKTPPSFIRTGTEYCDSFRFEKVIHNYLIIEPSSSLS